jgi:hypothetical protein
MKRKMGLAVALLLAFVALTAMTGCRWVKFPTFDETTSIPLRGATELVGEIQQSVGELTVRASATPTDAVGAEFTYAPESWKPDVSISPNLGIAGFRISSPHEGGTQWFVYTHYSWVITLPTGVITDLTLDLGVGNSTVDLRGIDLFRLRAMTGVGNTTIDLSGIRPTVQNPTVRIQSGVGNLTLVLPRDIGVAVTTQEKGVGNLSAQGFDRVGDKLTNAAYGGSDPQMEIEIVRGVGNVTLELAD